MTAGQQRVLREAVRIIARDGIGGLSMRRLAERLDVSATAIYRHFRDKGALLDALAEEGFAKMSAFMAARPRARAGSQQILRYVHGFVIFSLSEPEYYEVMFLTPRPGLRRFPAGLAGNPSRSFARLMEEVRAAMRRGEFRRDDPVETSLSIWAHAQGLVDLYRAGRFAGGRKIFQGVYTRSFERLLRGLYA